MMNLYRDPSGLKIFDGTHPTKHTEQRTTSEHQIVAMGIPDLTDTEKIDLLNVRVKGLEEMVKNKNQRIIELEANYKT